MHVIQEREQFILWFEPLVHRAQWIVNAQIEKQRHERSSRSPLPSPLLHEVGA